MKILYLWFDSYKKLNNFDMDFGSEYSFSMVKNKLIIKENKSYIKNFFETNKENLFLNISAVVGCNGVGKTTLLEVLVEILSGDSVDPSITIGETSISYIIIYEEDGSYYIQKSIKTDLSIEIENQANFELIDKEFPKELLNIVHYSNVFDNRCLIKDDISKLITRENYIDVSTNKFLIHMENVRDYMFQELNNQIVFFNSVQSELEFKNLIKMPNYMEIHLLDNLGVDNPIIDEMMDDGLDYLEIEDSIEENRLFIEANIGDRNLKRKVNNNLLIGYILEIYKTLKEVDGFIWRNSKMKNTIFLNGLREAENLPVLLDKIKSNIVNKVSKQFKINVNEILERKNLLFIDLCKHISSISFETSIKLDPDRVVEYIYFETKGNNNLDSVKMYSDFFEYLDVIKFSWSDLSSGEYSLLTLFSRLHIAVREIVMRDNTLILIDEGDLYFHPQWQKDWLQYFIEIIELIFDKNIQVVVTTHSPFILSDFPHYNVTFLYDKGYIDNTLGSTRTFAANIIDLFTNSFFIKDGLVGKFSKNKINTFTNHLLIEDSNFLYQNKKDILKFIDLIGEPLVKNKLYDIYQNRVKVFREDALDERIKRLEEELEFLKGKRDSE